MKYDRTKDIRKVGRYARVKLREWEGTVLIDLDKEKFAIPRYDDCIKPTWLISGNNYGDLPFSSIIKTADTVVDLCDGLIVEEEGNPNNWFIMEVDEFKNEKEHLKGWTYRAFIKTKEGLIYAAEMNSEGKLKLL